MFNLSYIFFNEASLRERFSNMTITRRNLLASILVLDFFFKLVTAYLLALNAGQPILVYLSMLGSYALVLPTFIIVALGSKISLTQKNVNYDVSQVFEIYCFLTFFYLLSWMVFGLLIGHHPKDALGSTLRAVLPFMIILISLISLPQSMPEENYKYLRKIINIFAIVCAILIFGKITLLIQGISYGGGMNQFRAPAFIFPLTIIMLTSPFIKRFKKYILSIVLILISILIILSFKRGAWLDLILMLFLTLMAMKGKVRFYAVIVALLLLAVLYYVLSLSGYDELIIRRFEQTFSNSDNLGSFDLRSLDESSYTRVAEIISAIGTLDGVGVIGWLTGLGPGAGYTDSIGFGLKGFNEYGQLYHIHSGAMLIIFRYGLIGFALYVVPVFIAVKLFFYFSRALRRAKSKDSFLIVALGLSCSIVLIKQPLALMTSNAIFGSVEYGYVVALLLLCKKLTETPRDVTSN